MNEIKEKSAYCEYPEPTSLKITRTLPGPIDRVWDYLTKSELRQKWMASGIMGNTEGSVCELVWRNDDLTDSENSNPSLRPENFPETHKMEVEIIKINAPNYLAISWGSTGGVVFELKEQGKDVILSIVHSRVLDKSIVLNISAGWHTHINILEIVLRGQKRPPFWENWLKLRAEYAEILK